MNYRSDVDGLRAIAVLSVVLFHLGIGVLPGGYVGVDIFFVISGYLISKIIYSEVEQKTFSIANFYVRRARRIVPGFLSVVGVSFLAAYLMLYPSELVSFSNSVVASTLFSANIYFYSTLNYFSPSANEIPLLHLWSLGIEEQFYIFFPLIVIGCAAVGRKVIPLVVVGLLLVSLVLSQKILSTDPTESFYLLPFRAFELLIGSFIALPSTRFKKSKVVSVMMFGVGILALTYPICFYDNSVAFPGVAAALPCVGAALIILASEQTTFLSRTLGSRPLVFIGKISYSLYLVHWPLIVFARRAYPGANKYCFALIIFLTSVILAFANYRLVEQRFRHANPAAPSRKVLSTAALALFSVVVVSIYVSYHRGFPGATDTRSAKALAFLQYNPSVDYRSGTCFLDPDQRPSSADRSSCMPSGPGRTAILWGDSHAIHLYAGLKETFAHEGISLGVLTASACPPILGIDVAARPYCKEGNDLDFEVISKLRPDILIMTAAWNPAPNVMDALNKTLDKVSLLGIKVVILGESPVYKLSVPTIVADRIRLGNKNLTSEGVLDQATIDNSERAVVEVVLKRADAKYISVFKAVCPKGLCPMTTADETPLHYDITHLTPAGSRYFAKVLTPLILK